MSSLTNFGLSVFVARAVAPSGLGAFALIFATYLLAMGICRALVSEPLVVLHSGTLEDAHSPTLAAAAGAAIAIGAASGLVCAVIGGLVGFNYSDSWMSLSFTLPGLLLQDTWRYGFFAAGRGREALVNDIVWAVLLFTSLALVPRDHHSVATYVLLWGASASAAAAYGAIQARVMPRVQACFTWLRAHRDLSGRFVSEFLTMTGSSQAVMYAVGAIAGLAALGALRAAQTALGPLNIAIIGLNMSVLPEAVRLVRSDAVKLRRRMVVLSLFLIGLVLCWLAVLLIVPPAIGAALLGASWAPATSVLIPLGVGLAGTGAAAGAVCGLRALASAALSLRARLVVAPFTITAGITGAAIGGALGYACGAAVALWFGAAIWWYHFNRACADARNASERQSMLQMSELGPSMSVGCE